jgi:hypothetical protein
MSDYNEYDVLSFERLTNTTAFTVKVDEEQSISDNSLENVNVPVSREYINDSITNDITKENDVNVKNTKDNYTNDSIVNSVINNFISRSQLGQKKYGTNLDRTDLSLYEWIIHAQEEHMDAILYLEKIKKLLVKSQ